MDAITALGKGLGAATEVNIDCRLTTALGVIDLAFTDFPLQMADSNLLSQDAEKIYAASLEVIGHPEKTAEVASLVEKRNLDTTTFSLNEGLLNNVIQGQKAEAQVLGNALQDTYSWAEPIDHVLSYSATLIAHQLV